MASLKICAAPFHKRNVAAWMVAILSILSFIPTVHADTIGILSFWVPELFALMADVRSTEGTEVKEYIFGARKFYVADNYHGHTIVVTNTGVGISNSAATTAIMLQKFPTITRLIGSGIAGGADPNLRIGDVVVPKRWALYQEQHFAKEREDGTHEIPDWAYSSLIGNNCGTDDDSVLPSDVQNICTPGVDTWNFTFIYPTRVDGANPNGEGDEATSEGSKNYLWFDVDPEMFAVAESIAPNITLANSAGNAVLDYQPVVLTGGNGVAGPTFVDNAAYRKYVFNTFQARAVDMETAAAAHVATQFGKKFLFFRSLSDLAGGEEEGEENSLAVFFQVAAVNAVTTLSAFLEALPSAQGVTSMPEPTGSTPDEDTAGLLGVLSFYEPELVALKAIMNQGETPPEELVFGGRKFYRGKIAGANVVASLTGVSIGNAAMTTALMLMLYPGVERIVGGGIAGGVNPSLRVGDVVIPERWAMYQMQLYAKEVAGMPGEYLPVDFERQILVGKSCGAYDGIDTYLSGSSGQCNWTKGETSNFDFMFPKTIQTPDPNDPVSQNQISEGETRQWWFEVDPEMLEVAREVTANIQLKNTANDITLDYTPTIVIGGNGVSGPTFVDNVKYRQYVFDEFQAQCLDMETAAVAHIAYQNDIPVLFFRSLSDLAGADQDGNVINTFFSFAAENAFTVTSAFIEAMYPAESVTDGPVASPTTAAPVATSAPTEVDSAGTPTAGNVWAHAGLLSLAILAVVTFVL